MEKFNLKGYKKTLHFKERYKQRLERVVGKFDLKKLNERNYSTRVQKDGNVALIDNEITIVISPQSKTLVTCFLTNQKKSGNHYISQFLKQSEQVLIKTQKELYSDFLSETEELRKSLDKNMNIGRTTQPKDIEMKKKQVDESMEELSKKYTKMKNICLQLEKAHNDLKNNF